MCTSRVGTPPTCAGAISAAVLRACFIWGYTTSYYQQLLRRQGPFLPKPRVRDPFPPANCWSEGRHSPASRIGLGGGSTACQSICGSVVRLLPSGSRFACDEDYVVYDMYCRHPEKTGARARGQASFDMQAAYGLALHYGRSRWVVKAGQQDPLGSSLLIRIDRLLRRRRSRGAGLCSLGM